EQYGELVVESDSLFAGVMGRVIVLETLVQIGLAFGVSKRLCRVVFLVNGGIGFALQLMQHVEEVTKLVEIIRHPQGHVTGGLVTGYESRAPIRGHAKANEMVILKGFEMRPPCLSRAI